jgi:hypothetical protein
LPKIPGKLILSCTQKNAYMSEAETLKNSTGIMKAVEASDEAEYFQKSDAEHVSRQGKQQTLLGSNRICVHSGVLLLDGLNSCILTTDDILGDCFAYNAYSFVILFHIHCPAFAFRSN